MCRTALIEGAISSAFAICWKWVLAVAIAVSINFLPWATDIAAAQRVEASECGNVSQYYNQASGLKGEELKAKLHELVAGHKRLSYAEVLQTAIRSIWLNSILFLSLNCFMMTISLWWTEGLVLMNRFGMP
jgi:hypothetical protein